MTRSVLVFGDSNTHGTVPMESLSDIRRYPRGTRWPDIMAAELGADWDVVAEGHPGRTSVFDDPVDGVHKSGLRVIASLLESHRPLDLVIVMLGTNDTKARFAFSAIDIAHGILRLADTILRSTAGPENGAPRVLLAAPVPILETGCLAQMFAGGAARSQALAAELATVARALGTGLIDLAPVAEVSPVDGIHLAPEAHEAVGRAMADAVREMF